MHPGNAGLTGAARHSTTYYSPNYLAGRGAAIRNGFNYRNNYFNQNWFNAHPGAWNTNLWANRGGGLGGLGGGLGGLGGLGGGLGGLGGLGGGLGGLGGLGALAALGGLGGIGGGLGGLGGGLGGLGGLGGGLGGLGGLWNSANYSSAANFMGLGGSPINYGYGSNIVYQGDNVYANGNNVATAEAYAASADAIAAAGRTAQPTANEPWQSLGVYGLVQGEEKTSNNLFQLALDKNGIIRGNYYDAIADNNLPVYGSINKKTQRAAWSVGDKKNIVYEAGLANLTQGESPVLIHYGKEQTRQMMLVRLDDQNVAQATPK